ncbi:PLP-dependent aminotransferase family protein [Gordonia terrae]|uniref:aminotransferase-like domain-containing protein n=1 Tax=Gordonia terrae TaxID=2055 RepID=UPI003F6A70E9
MPDLGSQLSARELSAVLGSWRTNDGTLSIGLATAIAHLIESEEVITGMRLPAQRSLATELGVSRGTVTTAYEILAGGGYVTAEVGRGSTVSMNRRRLRQPGAARVPDGAPPVTADLSIQSLPADGSLTSVLESVTQRSLRSHLGTDGHTAYGLPETRAAVARHLTSTGVVTSPDEILITAGAQQALWLIVFAMTDAGSRILVEEPTYRGLLAVLVSVRRSLRIDGYPAGSAELTVGAGPRPDAVYVQSSVHSPTGQVRTSEMLSRFASVVNAHDLFVIDDRSAADLVYDPDTQNAGLSGLVAPERLVTVGTMSKLVWGGLRVGWIRGHPHTLARLADLKQTVDVTTSVIDQCVAAELLDNAHSVIDRRREFLIAHRDRTIGVIDESRTDWDVTMPSGGSGLWIDIRSDAIDYAVKAQSEGIRIADGPSFSVSHGFSTHIRLPVWNDTDALRRALHLI